MGGRGQAVFPCLPGLVSGWLWQWDTGGKWKGVGKENWGVSFPYTLPHMVESQPFLRGSPSGKTVFWLPSLLEGLLACYVSSFLQMLPLHPLFDLPHIPG